MFLPSWTSQCRSSMQPPLPLQLRRCPTALPLPPHPRHANPAPRRGGFAVAPCGHPTGRGGLRMRGQEWRTAMLRFPGQPPPRGTGSPGSALLLPAVLNRRCPRCWTRPARSGGSVRGATPPRVPPDCNIPPHPQEGPLPVLPPRVRDAVPPPSPQYCKHPWPRPG